jgi:hypothetical protein
VNEEINCVAVDNTGNIYAAGYRYGGVLTDNDYHVIRYNGLPVISSINPASGARGKTHDVTVSGSNYVTGITASFSGTGITVNTVNVSGTTGLTLNMTVSGIALTGNRSLTLTGTDGAFYTKSDIFEVTGIRDVVGEAGSMTIVGSEERKGIINPDLGDEVQIYFKGTESGKYHLRIFTLLGELIYEKTKDGLAEGTFSWIPKGIASGIYIAHVKGPGIDTSKKIAILR